MQIASSQDFTVYAAQTIQQTQVAQQGQATQQGPVTHSNSAGKRRLSDGSLSDTANSIGREFKRIKTEQPVCIDTRQAQVSDATATMTRPLHLWHVMREKIMPMVSGAFPGCIVMRPGVFLEQLDPQHQYGGYHGELMQAWQAANTDLPYLDWLGTQRSGPIKGVLRPTQQQRQDYHRVSFEDNKVVLSDGLKAQCQDYFRRSGKKSLDLIFVIDREGRFYAGIKKKARFHHSSLSLGKPVRMAGTLTVDKKFRLHAVSNLSGHYRPNPNKVVAALHCLAQQNVDLSKLSVVTYDFDLRHFNPIVNAQQMLSNASV